MPIAKVDNYLTQYHRTCEHFMLRSLSPCPSTASPGIVQRLGTIQQSDIEVIEL